jgi:phosphate starvation-inducible PhoH-like protein
MKHKNLDTEDLLELEEYVSKPKPKHIINMTKKGNPVEDFKKSYTTSKFTCKTPNQKEIIKSINGDSIITVVSGKPGTGKTYSAIQGVLKEFKSGNYTKIYLLKSVKTLDNKSEDLGFLKGTIEDKVAPFMFSYDFNFEQIIDKSAYQYARENAIIDFLPLAYIRGIGLQDCIIILDEAQNVNNGILRTILSRVGRNSKIVILGDTKQKDSSKGQTSGLEFLIGNFNDIDGIDFIEMTEEDQSRSPLINKIEARYDELENKGINVE